MHWTVAILLFLAGIAAGALNSVAGGGAFIAFPALLFAGVAPVPANASQTVALWAGVTASGHAYFHRLDVPRRMMIPLLFASFAGGLLGAWLLLHTPQRTFMRLLPWLMLTATLLFVFGGRITARFRREGSVLHQTSQRAMLAAAAFFLLLSVYGGYFGGGLGFLTLAMLALLGMNDIHDMNAVKTVLGTVTNGVAVAAFMVAGAVAWKEVAFLLPGAVAGGWFGAHYAQRVNPQKVRYIVIAIGVIMTAYFFVRSS